MNTIARATEPIQDIHINDEVQINCFDQMTVLGKAIVTVITPGQITVKCKGDVYTFDLTNITINGKSYAESPLLDASAAPETAFAKLLDLAENPVRSPAPDLQCSKPIPNYTYYWTSAGKQILPFHNVNSHDPTLDEVIRYVKNAHISDRLYVPNDYVCGNFAYDLIHGAELAGLHCTLTSLSFRGEAIGHFVVAFHTTDYGLVFIDCTGGRTPSKLGTYDTIGYIKPGKSYGRLPLDIGRIDPNHYEFYDLAKAAINGVDSASAGQADIEGEKKALADEMNGLHRLWMLDSAGGSPLLKEKIEHYHQAAKKLKRDLAADQFRQELQENPYNDYQKMVTSVILW